MYDACTFIQVTLLGYHHTNPVVLIVVCRISLGCAVNTVAEKNGMMFVPDVPDGNIADSMFRVYFLLA